MDVVQFVDWLGAIQGAGASIIILPASCVHILKSGWEKGVITDVDVLDDSLKPTPKQMEEICETWVDLYTDSVAVIKETALNSDKTKLKRWLKQRYMGDVLDESSTGNIPLTPALLEDMAQQGATEPWQLGFIELALATARAPTRKDTTGYVHKCHWTGMDGGKLAL